MKQTQVFLAYTHGEPESGARAKEIAVELRSRGHVAWDSSQDITFGERILDEIEAGLRASDIILAILGPGDAGRPWLYFELGAASALHKPVLAVLDDSVDPSTLPPPLRLRHAQRWTTAREVAEAVDEALKRLGRSERAMAPPATIR